jgi:hypothetical protein
MNFSYPPGLFTAYLTPQPFVPVVNDNANFILGLPPSLTFEEFNRRQFNHLNGIYQGSYDSDSSNLIFDSDFNFSNLGSRKKLVTVQVGAISGTIT